MGKIALITYDGNNYGGCLQAYALQQTILRAGHDVQIIRKQLPWKPQQSQANKIWGGIKAPLNYLRRRTVIRRHGSFDSRFRAPAFEEFRQRCLVYEDRYVLTHENCYEFAWEEYDRFVCGSDQIWNPNLYGVDPIWFLRFVPKHCRKIAYAPSLGISRLEPRWQSLFTEALADFDFLSVREMEGAQCLAEILHRPVDSVLDPTLLLSAADWREVMKPVEVDDPYIFCYLFGSLPYIEAAKQRIKQVTGLQVVSLPYNLREMKSDDKLLYDIAPDQFVSLIAHASLVLTDSFHATAFAINLNTPFISLTRSMESDTVNMNSRLYTLLTKTGLAERLIDETKISGLTAEFLSEINFTEANAALSATAAADKTKLLKALANE